MTATTPTEQEIREFLEEAFKTDSGAGRCSMAYMLLEEATGELLGDLRHNFWRLTGHDDELEGDFGETIETACREAEKQARQLIINALANAGSEFARRQPLAPLVPQKAA